MRPLLEGRLHEALIPQVGTSTLRRTPSGMEYWLFEPEIRIYTETGESVEAETVYSYKLVSP